MPVFRLIREHVFPDPALADGSGLLAIGGDLHPDRLMLGYRSGIFPWYSEGEPILWYSPPKRFVLTVPDLHVGRSLAKRMRKGEYRITLDTAFDRVLGHCAAAERPGQDGTWITPDMRRAYNQLHALGHAHSVEAWSGDELVGGLYGVGVGRLFCGESMFALAPDASKIAFVTLVRQLERWGYPLIDSQVFTRHLERFGAFEVSREAYIEAIGDLVNLPGRVGTWSFDPE